jgi:hypothetical protein
VGSYPDGGLPCGLEVSVAAHVWARAYVEVGTPVETHLSASRRGFP